MSSGSGLVKIGAVWRGKDKQGRPMLTGKMGDARISVLVNGYKTDDAHPDYIVYVSAPEKKETEHDEGFDQEPAL